MAYRRPTLRTSPAHLARVPNGNVLNYRDADEVRAVAEKDQVANCQLPVIRNGAVVAICVRGIVIGASTSTMLAIAAERYESPSRHSNCRKVRGVRGDHKSLTR
jgi:hypothetical protein